MEKEGDGQVKDAERSLARREADGQILVLCGGSGRHHGKWGFRQRDGDEGFVDVIEDPGSSCWEISLASSAMYA